jgi:hypothetical protein
LSFWDSLVDRLETLGENVVEWAILIAVAIVVLVVGRWLIGLIRVWIEKLLGARALDPIWRGSGVARALEGGEHTPASIVATIVYAYLWVTLLLVVARILQLTAIEALLARLLAWVPLLLLAAVIVLVSAAAGNWAAGLVRPFAQEQRVPWLTGVVHVGVIVFGVLFAMEIVNIEFAEDIVKILIAAAAVAGAIAFGVGGIDAAKRWWAQYGSPGSLGVASSSPPPTPPPSAGEDDLGGAAPPV